MRAATIFFVLAQAALCAEVTVTRIIDGDTFETSTGAIVRLRGVDAPEKSQPGGPEASAALLNLVLDRRVELVGPKQAAYGRIEAEVKWRQWNIGATMVGRGHAWVDVRYLSAASREKYLAYQQQAQAKQAGLWKDDKPIAPWDWRSGKYSSLLGGGGDGEPVAERTPPQAAVAPRVVQPVYQYVQPFYSSGGS